MITALRDHGYARHERRWVSNRRGQYVAAKREAHRAVRHGERAHVAAQLEGEVLPCV